MSSTITLTLNLRRSTHPCIACLEKPARIVYSIESDGVDPEDRAALWLRVGFSCLSASWQLAQEEKEGTSNQGQMEDVDGRPQLIHVRLPGIV